MSGVVIYAEKPNVYNIFRCILCLTFLALASIWNALTMTAKVFEYFYANLGIFVAFFDNPIIDLIFWWLKIVVS